MIPDWKLSERFKESVRLNKEPRMNYSEIPKGLAPIPKGWEKCDLSECTHGMNAKGKLHEMRLRGNIVHIGLSTMTDEIFAFMEITPVRKVQPIEFTVKGIEPIRWGFYVSVQINGATIANRLDLEPLVGKTFREVIE